MQNGHVEHLLEILSCHCRTLNVFFEFALFRERLHHFLCAAISPRIAAVASSAAAELHRVSEVNLSANENDRSHRRDMPKLGKPALRRRAKRSRLHDVETEQKDVRVGVAQRPDLVEF